MWRSWHRATRAMLAAALLASCQSSPPPTPSTTPSASPSGSTGASPPAVAASLSPPPTVGEGEAWIVFQGAPLGLSLARPDGTGNHVILGPPGDQLHPDWSPDGSQIAYVQATDSSSAIWITDPQGTNPEPLAVDAPDELDGRFWDNPAWSPDGSRIATIGYEGNPQTTLPTRSVLAIIDVVSGELTNVGELASADGICTASPGGRQPATR